MPWFKKLLFTIAGSKYDRMAKKKNTTYDFVFVQPNGKELEEISKFLEKKQIRPHIDHIYDLKDVNRALEKVENGSSKGKTLLKISDESNK